jgi:hypothetical protein
MYSMAYVSDAVQERNQPLQTLRRRENIHEMFDLCIPIGQNYLI